MHKNSELKVVVVDDETSVLDIIQRYLRKKGWDVKGAEGALEAYSLLEEEDPDLWIIDIKLPGMSGLELAQRIRSADPEAKILLMTGYPDNEIREKMEQLNILRLVEKPVDPTVFHDVLSQIGQINALKACWS